MASNPVLKTVMSVVRHSESVSINKDKVKELARKYASEELIIPDWKAPVFPSETDNDTIRFLLLGNSINFAFSDFKTGKKYTTEYDGISFSGAFGMWAALKRGLEDGVPLFDVRFLELIGKKEINRLFEGLSPMPMLDERLRIFHEVGGVTDTFFAGDLAHLVNYSFGNLFGTRGAVSKLTNWFPSFQDIETYGGKPVIFNKRAQLAMAMIYGRFLGDGVELFKESEVKQFTVFADYELPKILNALGVLEYSASLSKRINAGILIAAGSKEEIELRANTVYAAKLLQDDINSLGGKEVNSLHIDYKLWSEGRNFKDAKHHFTITSAY